MRRLLCLILLFCTQLSAAPIVIFDCGGVLLDWKKEEVWAHISKTFHLSEQEIPEVFLNYRNAMHAHFPEKEFWEALAVARSIELPENWWETWRELVKNSIYSLEGFEIANALRGRGFKLGMLSNVWEEGAEIVSELGYYEGFDPLLLSYEIDARKPDHEAYEILMAHLGVPPHEIIFIDDRLENIVAACELGIDAIHYQGGDQLLQALEERGILVYQPIRR